MFRATLALVTAMFLFSCASQHKEEVKDYSRALPEGAPALELVTDPVEFPDFRAMFADLESLDSALEASAEYMTKPSSKQWFPVQEFTHSRVERSLAALREVVGKSQSPMEFAGFMRSNFDVYRSVGWNGEGEVLFTAYYQPIFDGRRERGGAYVHPVYGLPEDLVKDKDGTPLGRRDGERVVSYFSRAELEANGHLDGQGLEVAWLESKLDAFIIHVQGSAKLRLEDGSFMYIGYAGKTDREYTSIGKELVADGKIPSDELSLAAIRGWFDQNPEELDEYLQRNESYVFFLETGPGGPWGSLGAPVTAWRTIATDKSVFPRASPCAVETVVPRLRSGGGLTQTPITTLVFDQDTGGAIRSAGRCDLFVGIGDEAERIAGHTQHEGRLFYFLVKEDSLFGLEASESE